MKRFFLLLAGWGLYLTTGAQTPRWQLVWSDEFNYRGLPDSTSWGYERGFVRNQEPQFYTRRRPENARVDSGMLIIEARKEAFRRANYTSASLVTMGKESWRYGRIQVRAKVPAQHGSWPAIWMMGDNIRQRPWPFCGEIDIMEYLGAIPDKVFGTAHFSADSLGKHDARGGTLSPIVPGDGFHIYALDWYKDRMEFYYDTTCYFTFRFSDAPVYDSTFQRKFYLLLNLALGHEGAWAGPIDESLLPFRYLIDYVRVYRDVGDVSDDDPGAAAPPARSPLTLMKRVADWQLSTWREHGFKYAPWDWTNAVAYTGLYALGELSSDTTYTNALARIGDSLRWNTGPSRTMADDYCIGQMYAQLSRYSADPAMIGPFRRLADSIEGLPHTASLEWKDNIQLREWAWCDALFMGPPGLAYLSTTTGDQRYLDLADRLWWKTTDYLYDAKEHLYYRDSRYFKRREANGRPMFWARGDGWVMAGLVRMLANMPASYPDRARYVQLLQDMAARIAALQRPDGTWHASLLDPGSFPNKETSGTGLYCYALAWGVNHGILPAVQYGGTIRRAWSALVSAIQPDGRLGYVQRIGDKPEQTDASSTDPYGTGAFLLAGSEVARMVR